MGGCCGSRQVQDRALEMQKRQNLLSACNLKDLNKQFKIDQKCLGQGSYGKVFKGTNKWDTHFKVAIKVMSKRHLSAQE